MVSKKIVLFGVGSQTLVLRDILLQQGYIITHLLNDFPIQTIPVEFVTTPIIQGREQTNRWITTQKSKYDFAIAIGNHYGSIRHQKQQLMIENGWSPINIIHPTAVISSGCTLSQSLQMMAMSFVGVNCHIGESVTINTKATIDHECTIDHGCHIGPNATLTGRVKLGKNVFVGASATILPDVIISDNVFIGSGAVVCSDITESGTYIGIPAKRVSSK